MVKRYDFLDIKPEEKRKKEEEPKVGVKDEDKYEDDDLVTVTIENAVDEDKYLAQESH